MTIVHDVVFVATIVTNIQQHAYGCTDLLDTERECVCFTGSILLYVLVCW